MLKENEIYTAAYPFMRCNIHLGSSSSVAHFPGGDAWVWMELDGGTRQTVGSRNVVGRQRWWGEGRCWSGCYCRRQCCLAESEREQGTSRGMCTAVWETNCKRRVLVMRFCSSVLVEYRLGSERSLLFIWKGRQS